MVFLPAVRFAVQICLFWFAVVLVTRDIRFDWRSFILWVVAAHLAGVLVVALVGGSVPAWIGSLVMLVTTSIVLALVLNFKFGCDSPRQIMMIIGIYFGATFILDMILTLFASNVQSKIHEALQEGSLLSMVQHLLT